jgi:hypothetical protein
VSRTAQGRSERARHAALLRRHSDDLGAVDESRRRLKFLALAENLRRALAEPPLLGLTERRELAELLVRGR